MGEKDGEMNRFPLTSVSNMPTKASSIISLDLVKEKLKRGELTIKDILDSDDCINDLRTNPISLYKEIITTDNIKILIDYCLKCNKELNGSSQKDLRYPYYSSQILCSSCVLLFDQSIPNIRHSDNLIINKNKLIDNELKKKVNNSNVLNEKLESNQFNNNEYFDNKSKNNDDLSDSLNKNYNRDFNDDNSFNFLKDYENEIEEKYIESYQNLTETEMQNKTINNKSTIKYDDEDMKIIKEILSRIFDFLNCQKEEKILNENLTYWGYFKNIVNYLLINETDIMIEYLFGDSTPIIDKFYSHFYNTSIQIILENLLNILSDKEDNNIKYNDKYNDIINKLIQILFEDSKTGKFENSEFICELIINTLINNTEKQLIDLIINNNSIMKKIKNIIDNIATKENNEKVISNILKVLCQINFVILKSLNESLYKKVNNIINDYNKVNLFEYQYFCTKIISYKNIFVSFKDNILSYLFISEEIFKSISRDIKEKYNLNKSNHKDNNVNLNNNKESREFGMHNLYKWKFILSILRVFVYSYNATDKLKKDKYFYDKELFLISIELHFKYPYNNLYQNIFLEIIKLICLEECPDYLIESFLIINNEEKQSAFIFNLLKNIKINKDKKYNLTIGIDIEILKLFYSSNNKAILNHFSSSYLDNKYKSIFIKDSIKNKFDRQLDEDYEYSNDEIFDIENDNDDTFDGDDCEINREFLCFKNIISNFLDKIEEEKKNFNNIINRENINKNHINKMETKTKNEIQTKTLNDQITYNIGHSKYDKKEEKKILENKDGSIPNVEVKYSIEEKED